ncbi:hypothetical protein [Cylindrospermum stagnale]|uniref:hypothetical protein n=1 Tax=Cylindrospermum stagnale TaxID=142864 RepID=UPI0012F6B968|nr:hypothetical protein [Cylindrospermum stagnale]
MQYLHLKATHQKSHDFHSKLTQVKSDRLRRVLRAIAFSTLQKSDRLRRALRAIAFFQTEMISKDF